MERWKRAGVVAVASLCGTIGTGIGQCTLDWQPVGRPAGFDDDVLCAFVSGTPGEERAYFAGRFASFNGEIMRCTGWWDGITAQSLPHGVSEADVIAEHDGTMYVGGQMTVESMGSPLVARNASAGWEAVGGWYPEQAYETINAFASYRGELIAGGDFTNVTGHLSPCIARWNGQAWRPLGLGLDSVVTSLAVYRGELYAGGRFRYAGGSPCSYIARWDGETWRSVGGGLGGPVMSMTVVDDELFVCGTFRHVEGRPSSGIAAWTSDGWLTYGSEYTSTPDRVAKLNGRLFSAGARLREWNGAAWVAVPGIGDEYLGTIVGMFPFRGRLLLCGTLSGDIASGHVAYFDGAQFTTAGTGFGGSLSDVCLFEGRELVCGDFHVSGDTPVNFVGDASGPAWQPFGESLNGPVHALAVHNGVLFAGGEFTAIGGRTIGRSARWDGHTWQGMDTTLGGGTTPGIRALRVWNNELYAAGNFTTGGGTTLNHVARWDGSAWRPLGSGIPGGVFGHVFALAEYQGRLIAAGTFTMTSPAGGSNIAAWNGQQWSALGQGLDDGVNALTVFNGELIAVGSFTHSGLLNTRNAAAWNGSTWRQLAGLTGAPRALAVHENRLLTAGDSRVGSSGYAVAEWNNGTGWWQARGRGSLSAINFLEVINNRLVAGGNYPYYPVATSAYAVYAPGEAPTVTVHPADWNGCVGGRLSLRAQAVSGRSFTYRWLRNGLEVAADGARIRGLGTGELVIDPVLTADAGTYVCEFVGLCGLSRSDPAMVGVCIADMDCNGGFDGGDIGAFFDLWEAGSPGADVNGDGGVDGDDVTVFFSHWEAGTC